MMGKAVVSSWAWRRKAALLASEVQVLPVSEEQVLSASDQLLESNRKPAFAHDGILTFFAHSDHHSKP